MDDNVNAYLAEKMQPHLAKLKAPMGVYATLGNHDLFGDQDRIDQEIRKAGITVLRDETLTLNNELVPLNTVIPALRISRSIRS